MGCKRDLDIPLTSKPEQISSKIILPNKANPLSLRNVQKAKETLAATNPEALRTSARPPGGGTGNEPRFVYFKFDPQEITQEQFQTLESDSTVQIMDIPFANMAIYGDDFALDNEKAERLKDGSIYGVTAASNVRVLSSLSSRTATGFQLLDTLVKIAEEDTTLQFQAFREAGISEEQIGRFRICLFKKPHGFVRYEDGALNRLEPVRNMQVWSLFLGIPIYDYTDENGYYEIQWRYSIGTIMGTKAKNDRVNVKPLDTHGTLIRNIYTLITQFIVGSVHIEGWVTPCQMKDGKDFTFRGHTQVRYWSQILNAYHFHDQFTNNDGIDRAPRSMVCYAQWTNTGSNVDFNGVPDLGTAGAPMLGHISLAGTLVEAFLNGVFDQQINLASDAPNLLQLLLGVLPDMSIKVPQAAEPRAYNSRLSQIMMHELSHASHFRRVGNLWWIGLAEATISQEPVFGNPYGNGEAWNYTELAESWAEFLGTNYALRLYPGFRGIKRATNTIPGSINAGIYYQMDNLIENEFWFFGLQWIPYGYYHDLMDDTNIAPNNPGEFWDTIDGVTIRQLYDAHGPNITNMCSYHQNFIQRNPAINQAGLDLIYNNHNMLCR